MPHVIVKLYPGRSEAQKQQLAQAIAREVVAIAGCADKSVSVAIAEVTPANWADEVYTPDILAQADTLYKKPGYNPFQ
ncbi:MAG: tautomerase family protein [Desulfobacterales bacterium]|jgi:4-oxalocrotonate tautomerase